jgi:L-2,4-diaminobutyrate transaminase
MLGALRQALGDHPNVGDIRGEGLMMAVELVQDRAARAHFDPSLTIGAKVCAALLKRGVICRAMPQGDILGFAPPLCISPSEVDVVVGATIDAVAEVCGS